MRNAKSAALLLLASVVIVAQTQQPSAGPFGPLHKGPSKHVGEIRFAPAGIDYSLYGDHCEISDDKFLCLFTFDAHKGAAKEWAADQSWIANYAVDQFGEKHSKIGAYYLSLRGKEQSSATLGAGDKAFFVQVFENADKSITRLNIVSPYGQIKDLSVE